MSTDMAPEFHIVIQLSDVPPQGREIAFEADEEQRRGLAARFDLIELRSFKGTGTLRPWRRIGYALEGRFEADVVQACVVSLEPVEARLTERFKVHFLPAEYLEADAGAPGSEREIVIDPESDEPPEAMSGNHIDVGEVLAEQLALSLDPYPRKQGAVFEEVVSDEGEVEEVRPNPFAVLEKLKKND